MWLMSCVVEEEWCGWMLRDLSGTYGVIVIRPQLSRTATTSESYASNGSCISILYRPECVIVSLLMIR